MISWEKDRFYLRKVLAVLRDNEKTGDHIFR